MDAPIGHAFYQAAYAFQAENEHELSLQEGDVIQVYRKDGDWWEGVLGDGRAGLFPANRVVEYYENDTYAAEEGNGAAAEVHYGNGDVVGEYEDTGQDQAPQQYVPVAQYYGGGLEVKSAAAAAMVTSHGIRTTPNVAARAQAAQMAQVEQQQQQQPPQKGQDAAKKGQAQGGGGDADKSGAQCETRFGVWASNMSIMTGVILMLLGVGSMVWGVKDDEQYGLIYVLCGLYAVLMGICQILYEYYWGYSRSGDTFPWRAIIYLLLTGFLFASVPTVFGAALMLCVVAVNFVAARLGEEYQVEEERTDLTPQEQQSAYDNMGWCDRLISWVLLKKEQNEFGTLVFLSLYWASNIIIFVWALAVWIEKNDDFAPGERLSGWGPFAKAFGNVLDWNCSIILLPVCRTLIRVLYNMSTANQGCVAKSLRAVLNFIPLDHALEFHMLIAKVVAAAAIGHTVMHLFNFINAPEASLDKFGLVPWVTGGIIFICMLFMYSSAVPNVKRGQFEIFWYSHHLFIGFFFFLLIHGDGGWNPQFWKWFLFPGTLYIFERLLRVYRAKKQVVLLSVTHMQPSVISVEFAKEGVFASPYKEGQYIFIKCPAISRIQWHPFTISSAPQEKTITLHIKKLPPGSWTHDLMQYLTSMGPAGATYFELTRQSERGLIPGKITGPDGRPLLEIDGPHSAPTQHVTEYHTTMITGGGIGVTPVAATMKSVVLHRWKYYMGQCFPDNAYFYWVCNYREIDAFRWLIRAIKECEDEIYDMRAKNPRDMNQKRFEVHIYVTSVPKDQKPVEVVVDDEIGFWGVPYEDRNIDKVRAPFNEVDLYACMKCPPYQAKFGDVCIYNGRPRWDERFQAVVAAHPKGDIGVTFCGNPFICADLKTMCHKYSSLEAGRVFKLHKENF